MMLLGLGFFTIFQSAITYLVDTYLMLSASALAASMFMRSVLAAAFPLFAKNRECYLVGSAYVFRVISNSSVQCLAISG
jgi:hypothetical protein